LSSSGILNKGQTRSLLVKLGHAETRVADGRLVAAHDILQSFVDQVNDWSGGVLSEEDAADLASCGLGLINRTGQENPDAAGKSDAAVAEAALNTVGEVPETYALEQNFPNPFNPTSNIKFSLPEAADVNLAVYNMLGQRVMTLVSASMQPGFHQVDFDARDLPSGMYIYRIEAGNFVSTRKMMLLK
jgi:hypothetical protein